MISRITKTLPEETKNTTIKGITETLLKMMEKITTEKSAKNRAKNWSRAHSQSKKTRIYNTILFNLLNGKQNVPARPRDFRLNLAPEDEAIDGGDLSDILRRLVDQYMLDPKRENFPFPRGWPKSYLSKERRGSFSYYDQSKEMECIDIVLKDPDAIRTISNVLSETNILFGFLKYSFAVAFYQMKENKGQAFLNSFRDVGITIKQLELNNKKPGPWIPVNRLSNERLEKLAGQYARTTLQFWKGEDILIYTIAGLLYFGKAYGDDYP